MKIKVVIVDDELLARERLRRLLQSERDVAIVAECENGPSALQAVQLHRPDLLLLDIQMPEMDGFDVIRMLPPDHVPAIVFVTAFDRHAVRAFEERALDYLLKPTTPARLAETLARVRERLASRTQPAALPQSLIDFLSEREAAAGRVRRLSVRSGERVVLVPVEEIDWIEAAGNYVILHTPAGTHIHRTTMSTLEGQLPPEMFCRVSRSAILNLRQVKELQSITSGEHVAILSHGQRVPFTRSIREVEERLRFA